MGLLGRALRPPGLMAVADFITKSSGEEGSTLLCISLSTTSERQYALLAFQTARLVDSM
jgi:hypothetical protein